MNLRPLTDGAVSGTGTVTLNGRVNGQGGKLGAVCVTTNGSNAATVIVREDNGSGDILFDISTVQAQMCFAPVATQNGTQTLYYDISGTGGQAMLYEWVD